MRREYQLAPPWIGWWMGGAHLYNTVPLRLRSPFAPLPASRPSISWYRSAPAVRRATAQLREYQYTHPRQIG